MHVVNTGCSEGQVTWRYPHGGLRVTFAAPAHATGDNEEDEAEVDVCCMVGVAYCDVRLSLDDGDTLRLITVLKSSSSLLSSSSESTEVCFRSSRDRVVSLYVESLTSQSLSPVVGRLVVDYDVTLRRHGDNMASSRDMRGETFSVIRPWVQSCRSLCSLCTLGGVSLS